MLRVLLVVLPLGLDKFPWLSTVLGALPLARERRLRIAALFAAAEGLMPAIGLLLGLPLGHVLVMMGKLSGRRSPHRDWRVDVVARAT